MKDAVQKLGQLTADSSPLAAWLSLAAENTSVDATAADGVFQPVQAAVAALGRDRESLAALGASLEKAAGRSDGDATALVAAVSQQTLEATKKIEAAFHAGPARCDATLSRLLEEPINGARNLLRTAGPAEWDELHRKRVVGRAGKPGVSPVF